MSLALLSRRLGLVMQPLAPRSTLLPLQCTAPMSAYSNRRRQKKRAMEAVTANQEVMKMDMDERRAMAVRRKPQLVTFEAKYLGQIIDSWVPLAAEQKASFFSTTGLRQRVHHLRQRFRSTLAVVAVRRMVKGWRAVEFAVQAEQQYISARSSLFSGNDANREKVADKFTGNEYLRMQGRKKQHPGLVWHCLRSVERPRIAHVVVAPVGDKKNLYSQVTVRMLLEEAVAPANVVPPAGTPQEHYVVFERHLADEKAGAWRIAGHVVPPPASGSAALPAQDKDKAPNSQ